MGLKSETSRRRTDRPLDRGALLFGNILEVVLPLVRNIALAHLLAPEQLGISFSLALVIALAETLTGFGLYDFILVRSRDQGFQDAVFTLQSLALARACLIGAVLIAVGPAIAALLHSQHHGSIFQMLSLVVIVRSFENLAVKEAIARLDYLHEATVVIASQIIASAVTIIAAFATGSFECMFWGLLAGATTVTVLSNILSPHRFRLDWDPMVVRAAVAFGRPLVVSGMAIGASSTDRLAIGSLLNPSQLAYYNVAVGTALLPRWIMLKFLNLMFMPLLVSAQDRPASNRNLHHLWCACLVAVASLYSFVLAALGDIILGIVFGTHYQPSRYLMSLVALNLFIKLCMSLPGPAAYIGGKTQLVALGSFLSASSLLPSVAFLYFTRSIEIFMLAITGFEMLALFVYLWVSLRIICVPSAVVWTIVITPIACLVVLAAISALIAEVPSDIWALYCVISVICVGAVLMRSFVRSNVTWGLAKLVFLHSAAGARDESPNKKVTLELYD